MPASLNVKPMRSCPKLSNNTPEMLVAAILDVRLAAVSHFLIKCRSDGKAQIVVDVRC